MPRAARRDIAWLVASALLGGRFGAAAWRRIDARALTPGARLPSVRDCARQHGVSPHTVVAAYDQLQAAGMVEARSQRGFYVRETRPAARAPAVPTPPVVRQAPMDAPSRCTGWPPAIV